MLFLGTKFLLNLIQVLLLQSVLGNVVILLGTKTHLNLYQVLSLGTMILKDMY